MQNQKERIAYIERELRIWKTVVLIGVVVAAVAVFVGAAPNDSVAEKVVAKEFVLAGDDGTVFGRIFKSEVGVHLSLKEPNGFSNVMLTANNQRAGLYLDNQSRSNTASLEAYLHGGALGLSGRTDEGPAVLQAVSGVDGNKIKFQRPDVPTQVLPED